MDTLRSQSSVPSAFRFWGGGRNLALFDSRHGRDLGVPSVVEGCLLLPGALVHVHADEGGGHAGKIDESSMTEEWSEEFRKGLQDLTP
jgi:hypothetical protein